MYIRFCTFVIDPVRQFLPASLKPEVQYKIVAIHVVNEMNMGMITKIIYTQRAVGQTHDHVGHVTTLRRMVTKVRHKMQIEGLRLRHVGHHINTMSHKVTIQAFVSWLTL